MLLATMDLLSTMASGIVPPMPPVALLLPRPALGQPLPAFGEGARPQAFGFEPHAFALEPHAFWREPQAFRELPHALSARHTPFAAKLIAATSQNRALRRAAVPPRILIANIHVFDDSTWILD